MTTIKVPASINDAAATLNGIDALLTAKGWERAAIVYAFTAPGRPGPKSSDGKASRLDFGAFAKLGIRGLTDRQVVAEYRTRWAEAIEDGHAQPVKPGDKVTMPTIEWPGRQDTEGQKRYTAQKPESFARALDQGHVDTEEFADNLTDDQADRIVRRVASNKLQRSGINNSPANQKAANAAAHQALKPFHDATDRINIGLIFADLAALKDNIEHCISNGTLDEANLDAIAQDLQALIDLCNSGKVFVR